MDVEEAVVAQREEQRNTLESYLYRLRDLLDGDDQQPFVQCSREAERRAISRKLEEVFRWFHDNSDHAQTQDFREKRASIEYASYFSSQQQQRVLTAVW